MQDIFLQKRPIYEKQEYDIMKDGDTTNHTTEPVIIKMDQDEK